MAMTKWIEASERLPSENEDGVIVQNTDGEIDVLWNLTEDWNLRFETWHVVRWMLLRASCGADHPVPVELGEVRE